MRVCLFGCFDTKGPFLHYFAEELKRKSADVTLVDVGSEDTNNSNASNVEQYISNSATKTDGELEKEDGEFAKRLAQRAIEKIQGINQTNEFEAMLSCGGSNGTTIAMSVMKQFTTGSIRKVCVSTVCEFVENPGDVELIPSIVDIIDLNPILKAIASYAAARVTNHQIDNLHADLMLKSGDSTDEQWAEGAMEFLRKINCSMEDNNLVALTMFGNTTKCIEHCLQPLKSHGYQPLVFHAVGRCGGKVMAHMIRGGMVCGLLDITTTELADHLCGGVLAAGEGRFTAALAQGIPTVVSTGALDMINFGLGKIPEDRKTSPSLEWNPFHLSRTNLTDNQQMGDWLRDTLCKDMYSDANVKFVVPKTFSEIGNKDGKFYDPEANAALIEALKKGTIPVIEYDGNINDQDFAELLVETFCELVRAENRSFCRVAKNVLSNGKKIIGAGAGSGLAARALESGGADLLVVYNSGYFRSHGFGSLSGLMPFANANQLTFELGRMVLSSVNRVPVLAGLCAQDPGFWVEKSLEKARDMEFSGVQNFPTVGLIDAESHYRASLEETGLGYGKEVKMIARAVKLGLLTSPYVFTETEALAMAKTGTKIIVIHLGLTIGPSGLGKTSRFTVESAIPFVKKIKHTVRSIRPDCLLLIHGGPVNRPQDYMTISNAVDGLDGFYGASTFERNPPYDSILDAVAEFRKCICLA